MNYISLNKENTKFLEELSMTNDPRFILLKAAEELNELSVLLIQAVTKADKVDIKRIESEIADVLIQLHVVTHSTQSPLYEISQTNISELIDEKVDKLIQYKNTVENFGNI